jgi:solute carrier family 38 (sodium-coupled neutral amino acid transporter), member 7/8
MLSAGGSLHACHCDIAPSVHSRAARAMQVLSVLGSRASEVMAWTIFLFLFGSCVAFMIIVGDTFGMVLRHFVIEPLQLPVLLAARQFMIIIPGLTIMLPLSLQRSMGSLATASTLAVGVMVLTTVVIFAKAAAAFASGTDDEGADILSHVALYKLDVHTFAAMPIVIFAYHCHIQSVPIYFELTDRPSLLHWLKPPPPTSAETMPADVAATPAAALPPPGAPHGHPTGAANGADGLYAYDSVADVVAHKLKGMYAVLATAYAECTVLYLATGVAGYVLFPWTTSSNILNNFAKDDLLMQAMRFAVGWAVVLHYPINQHVARSALYDLVCRCAPVNACWVRSDEITR